MTNTIDKLGDEVTFHKIVEKTLTELHDDIISIMRTYSMNESTSLTSVALPNLLVIPDYCFRFCYNLSYASFSSLTEINSMAFRECRNLILVINNEEQVCSLKATNAFQSSDFMVYVPDSLVENYKAATNWSTYADRIKGISELPAE